MTDLLPALSDALVDRYRIERELGRGGMAIVYQAHDVRHDRPVALKVLLPQISSVLGSDRFLQEIRVTARLRHPHILPLFDSGEAGGLLFYVMPLVEGESLRARLSREPALTVDEAVRLTVEVADALGHAHAQGIVHRDVKPENILLESGHAMVADFGIARAVRATEDTRLTRAGLTVGTPDYMSPEQAGGDSDVDGRSDLYSLACVLFEMLTGAPPFTGPTPEAALVKRFTTTAPRLSTKRPNVSANLDHALARALARDAADRFETITAFAAAVTEPAAGVAQPTDKSIAVLPFADMSADPDGDYFGDGIAEEIINALTQLPGLKVAARTSAFSFKGKNEDLRTVGERLGVTNVLEGSVRRAGSRVRITAQLIEVASGYHLWSERFDRELNDIFAIQDDIATGIAAKLRVTLGTEPDLTEQIRRAWDEPLQRLDAYLRQEQLVKARTDNVEAYERYLQGRSLARHRGGELASAVTAFEQAVALDPNFASAHAELAQAIALLAFWGVVPANEVRERALTAAARAMASDPRLPEANTATALTALLLRYDRSAASAAWQRAIDLDPSNPDTRLFRAMFDLTYVRGDFEGALVEVRAALERDPESAYAHSSHAVVLVFARQYQDAVTSANRAVELDPSSLYAQWGLFQSLGFTGRVDEVLAHGRQVLSRFGRHPWLLLGISIAGAVAGRPALAEAVYRELTGRAGIEPVQPIIIAGVAANAGRHDEAIALMESAAAAREPLLTAFALHWPGLAPLKADPRFNRVLAAMGWDRPSE